MSYNEFQAMILDFAREKEQLILRVRNQKVRKVHYDGSFLKFSCKKKKGKLILHQNYNL